MGFPDNAAVKNSPAHTGDIRDLGSIPGSGRSPGVENGNVLQYSYLENSMDRGAWWATVHGVAKSQTRLHNQAHTHVIYKDVVVPFGEFFSSQRVLCL